MDSEEPLRTWIVAYADRLVRLAYTYVQDQSTAETFARPFMERLFPGLVLCPIIERDSAVNDHSKIAPNHWSTVPNGAERRCAQQDIRRGKKPDLWVAMLSRKSTAVVVSWPYELAPSKWVGP